MKVFSKQQIYDGIDAISKRQGITFNDLMERGGTQVFNWLHTRMQGAQVPVHVFCGIGNNGGSGLVLARHLITHGYNVITYIANCSDKRSKDFLINYDRIKNVTKDWPILLTCKEDFPEIGSDDIIIDAVFGIGLNRPIDDWIISLFQHFKDSKAYTVSIDIPSGLFLDKAPENENAVVSAGYTLSFGVPKLVFFLPETAKYTVQWEAIDVGADLEYQHTTIAEAEVMGKLEVLQLYKPREKFAHKGDYGHSLVIGGSYGKIGAALLASRSALSVGSGLVTAYVPRCGYTVLQSAFPEAMVITDTDEEIISAIKFDIEPTVISFGVGVGLNKKTIDTFKAFLKTNKTPLVIDADGINILSKHKSLLKQLPEHTILTPHIGELKELIGTWTDDFDKLEKTKALAKKHKIIILIKGAHTITVTKNRLYINSTGNPGLATAGTGDVLTGIITGLIAQGYNPLNACIFGTYLHGKSADIALENFGYQSLIASHVIEFLGDAYLDLFKQPEQPQVEEGNKEEG